MHGSLQQDHSGRFYYCWDLLCEKCEALYHSEERDPSPRLCFFCKRDQAAIKKED